MSAGPTTQKLQSELSRQIKSYDLTGASLVVAVSGGPDSLALVHALHSLQYDLGLQLHVAHMDHSLRPESSEIDANFVRGTMESLGLPLTIEHTDVAAFRDEQGLSTEDAARRLRYGFLARVAADQNADAVALGHTLDDQAETVLMHILRGTGLTGLRGMEVLSDIVIEDRPVSLFRPLLSVTKAETAAYCTENGLEPHLDESNLSTEFTRNRIRLDLMPLLEEYNPSVQMALTRLAQSASLDMGFIQQQVSGVADEVIKATESGVSLNRRKFSKLHPALQHHLLRHAVQQIRGNLTNLELSHVEDMARLMSGPAGKSIDLPGGLVLQIDYDRAHLRTSDLANEPLPKTEDDSAFVIKVPGVTNAGAWTVTIRCLDGYDPSSAPAAEPGPLMLTERFDADSLGSELCLRTRSPGDTFQPLGMPSDKKLKDFMIDTRIPQRWRDRVPLIESGGRIAWVGGYRIADWAKVTDTTQRVLEIKLGRS